MPDSVQLTAAIKAMALESGFARVGVAPAQPVQQAQGLRQWLAKGWHGEMAYMAENLPKRLDPTLLVPGARTVICLAVSYAGGQGSTIVARFARGRDYHTVLKKRCRALMDRIRAAWPAFQGRAFVDSAPVMERSLAVQAGIGWIGLNGCLCAPGVGSYVLLCEIVCNLDLRADSPVVSGCDGCGACVAACPTGALGPGGLVDCRRCISYLTIEHRGQIAPDLWPQMGCGVFGCDRCQAACPHNAPCGAGDAELTAPLAVAGLTVENLLCWQREDWDRLTRGSALRRAKYEMLLRNAIIAAGNSGDPRLAPLLKAVASPQGELAGLADLVGWAASRCV